MADSPVLVPAQKERSHAGSAYHAAVQWRLNLLLIPAAHVERIISEAASPGSQAVASGVQFLCGGRKNIAKARREVILSAGVSRSPRLPEVSGIGSAELLRSHGIDVTHNNPFVGGGVYHHAGQKPMLISTRRPSGLYALRLVLRCQGQHATRGRLPGSSCGGDSPSNVQGDAVRTTRTWPIILFCLFFPQCIEDIPRPVYYLTALAVESDSFPNKILARR